MQQQGLPVNNLVTGTNALFEVCPGVNVRMSSAVETLPRKL